MHMLYCRQGWFLPEDGWNKPVFLPMDDEDDTVIFYPERAATHEDIQEFMERMGISMIPVAEAPMYIGTAVKASWN